MNDDRNLTWLTTRETMAEMVDDAVERLIIFARFFAATAEDIPSKIDSPATPRDRTGPILCTEAATIQKMVLARLVDAQVIPASAAEKFAIKHADAADRSVLEFIRRNNAKILGKEPASPWVGELGATVQ